MKYLWVSIFFFYLLTVSVTGQSANGNRTSKLRNVHVDKVFDGLFKMSRGFIDAVKPKENILEKVLEYVNGDKKFDHVSIKEMMSLEAGFATCLIFGLILFFGLGLGGFFFCCCRCCCGNCGGKNIQRPKENLNAKRKTYSCLLFITIIFMTVPVVFTYLLASEEDNVLPKTENKIFDVLDDGILFFNTTYERVNKLTTNDLNDTTENITSTLHDIKSLVGEPIKKFSSETIQSNLEDGATEIDSVKKDFMSYFNKATDNFEKIKTLSNDMAKQLISISDGLTEKQKKCNIATPNAPNCQGINPKQVKAEEAGDVSKSKLDKFPDIPNFLDEIEKAKQEIDKIPDTVLNETKTVRTDIIDKIRDFTSSMENNNVHKELTRLSNVTMDIEGWKADVRKFFKDVKQYYGNNTKYSMFGVAGLLTIPIVLLLLGMMCGMAGHRKSRHPGHRGSLSNCGGCSVITAVYLLFFISGIPVFITVVLFQVGGHVKSVGCDAIYEENLQSLNKIYKLVIKDNNETVIASDALIKCKNKTAMFKAFELDKVVDITKELNFEEKLKLNTSLEDLSVDAAKDLFPDIKGHLKDLQEFYDTPSIRDVNEKLGKTFINGPGLEKWMRDLKSLNMDELGPEIGKIDDLNKDNIKLDKQSQEIRKSLDEFPNRTAVMEGLTTPFSESVDQFLHDIQEKTEQEKNEYIEGILSTAHGFVKHVINEIEHIDCEQLWVAFDVARYIVCHDVLDPINAYWFCLGWFVFFSIFAIAFGTKLARHYHRMSDTPEDNRTRPSPKYDMQEHRSPYLNHAYREDRPPRQDPPPYWGRDNRVRDQDSDERMNGWTKY